MTSTIVEVRRRSARYGARCDVGLRFRGWHAARRHPAPARRRTAAADAAQQRQAAVRRAAVGGQGAAASTTRSPGCCPSRGVEVLLLADLLTEALAKSGAARMHGIAAAVDPRRLGLPLAQELSTYLRTLDAGAAGVGADGGDDVQRAAVQRWRTVAGATDAPRRRFRHRSAAESAVHPRLVVLDRPARGDHVAGVARARPRDVTDRPDLRAPPAVPGRAARLRVAIGARRGWRRAAAGAGSGRGGSGGADHACGRGGVGAQPVRR